MTRAEVEARYWSDELRLAGDLFAKMDDPMYMVSRGDQRTIMQALLTRRDHACSRIAELAAAAPDKP